jgi:elongation factor 1-beta
MADVVASIKIMPDSVDRDLNKLMEDLKKAMPASGRLQRFDLKPIGFGLKAIMATVTVDDSVGGTEPVEEAFSKVEGVESVTVEATGRAF